MRPEGPCDVEGLRLPSTLDGLPPLVLVHAAQDIDLDAQPDEGPQAEAARTSDAAEEAARAAELREKELRAAEDRLLELRGQIEEAAGDPERQAALPAELDAAAGAAKELARKAAAGRSKAEELRRRAAAAEQADSPGR
ncbi:MAG: hypothetical protein Fur0037_16940 [Planctomycetota bacterium]